MISLTVRELSPHHILYPLSTQGIHAGPEYTICTRMNPPLSRESLFCILHLYVGNTPLSDDDLFFFTGNVIREASEKTSCKCYRKVRKMDTRVRIFRCYYLVISPHRTDRCHLLYRGDTAYAILEIHPSGSSRGGNYLYHTDLLREFPHPSRTQYPLNM